LTSGSFVCYKVFGVAPAPAPSIVYGHAARSSPSGRQGLSGGGAGQKKGVSNSYPLPDEAVTPEYMADHLWLIGSPETVATKLRKLYHV
jgi:alkanesulfonate monooxygenase SsuD/methylene tetrahydromethanopterin reductase-like flavin-dependent oxidoreductase (luciferase family)